MLQKRSAKAWATFKEAVDSPTANPLILPTSPFGNLSHTILLPTPSDTPSPAPASPHFSSPGSTITSLRVDLQFPVNTVITGYNPNSPANVLSPCKQGRDENAMWTDHQRQAAVSGVKAQDVAHLRELVRTSDR